MANNNLDPVQLAKRVSGQLVKWSVGQKNKRKSLQWKIDSLKWKFAKQNFGDCCKMIMDGAEVALKVEEELSNMEARVEGGEGGERLRLKVKLVRRKVERYYRLIHLFSVSKNPREFADCLGNLNTVNGGKSRAPHQIMIQLSEERGRRFVKWKGGWGKGRAFVQRKTGATVKNGSNTSLHKLFLISGDESTVQRAINVPVTQNPTAIASTRDYDIVNMNRYPQ